MKYKYEYIKTIDYWSIIISDIYDGGTVMFIYHGGTSKWTIDYWWYPYFIQLRWWIVRTKRILSIWSLPHSAVHSCLCSRHMKKQRSTFYRKWASYGFEKHQILQFTFRKDKIITYCNLLTPPQSVWLFLIIITEHLTINHHTFTII